MVTSPLCPFPGHSGQQPLPGGCDRLWNDAFEGGGLVTVSGLLWELLLGRLSISSRFGTVSPLLAHIHMPLSHSVSMSQAVLSKVTPSC